MFHEDSTSLTALKTALNNIDTGARPAPGTREARIDEFYRLLRELPAGPERDAEIARRSGMTDTDFMWLYKDNERAARQDDAMIKWQMEQNRAWRQNVIGLLTRWDEYSQAQCKAVAVTLRDFFQRLAGEDGTSAA